MKDIAKDLGIAVITVSKALRDHPDISPVTRQRVRDHAKKVSYRPNMVARSLVTGQSYTVGLVISDLMHSFFVEIAKGVEERIAAKGYQVIICNTNQDPEHEKRQIDLLLGRRVDGLIIASSQQHGYRNFFRMIEARKVPYVLIDEALPGLRANYVGVKDEELGAIATEHLIEQGCRRIAHIRGPAVATAVGRLRGYRRALARHGLQVPDEYVVSGRYFDEAGYEAMKDLLKLQPLPDGVFCYNDPVAVGALKAILEAGLRVPTDIAVIGAANVHYMDMLRVPLSTVDQNSTLMGEKAAELLLQSMEAKTVVSPQRVFLPVRLVARDSSKHGQTTITISPSQVPSAEPSNSFTPQREGLQ
jgi:LacI family transcriptional regulator